jgi:AraC-like DNA-binding protein
MSLPHLERPICEPVELPPEAPVRAEHIRHGREARRTEAFVHFHDAVELVVFGRVAGPFDVGDRRYVLEPNAVVFIPSLITHDFLLEAGPRDWTLVQIAGSAGQALLAEPALARLRRPLCARPEPRLYRRLAMLADWLVDLDGHDRLALPVAGLLLRAVAGAPELAGERLPASARSLERLRPAIDRLRQAPAQAPGAEQAAALCALSPGYFSRRFKQQVGMSWSDYVRTHRLHLASRRLLASDQPVATIAADLGFATPSHFGSVFTQRFGVTPGQYRLAGRARRQSHA